MSAHDTTGSAVDVNGALELLGDATRRALFYAAGQDGETDVAVVARRVAGWRPDDTTPAAVESSLYHVHLPKLADAGVVDYDSETDVVTVRDTAAGLDPYLRVTREREPALFRAARSAATDDATGV